MRRASRTSPRWTRPRPRSRPACSPAAWSATRPRCPCIPPGGGSRPLWPRLGPAPRRRLLAVPQPGAGIQRTGLRRPAAVPEAGRRHRRGQRRAGCSLLRVRPGLRRASGSARPNGVWNLGSPEATELTKLAETTYRDVNIALANEFARFAEVSGIDIYQVIEAANSQPFSHLHRPGIAVGGHCIPVYPRLYLAGDPAERAPGARPGRSTRPCPARRCGRSPAWPAAWPASGWRCSARLTASGRQGDGVLRRLRRRGGARTGAAPRPVVHDPLYTEAELRAARPASPTPRRAVRRRDRPDRPQEYRRLAPGDLPGVRALVDGRAITDASLWATVPRHVLGVGAGHACGGSGQGGAGRQP